MVNRLYYCSNNDIFSNFLSSIYQSNDLPHACRTVTHCFWTKSTIGWPIFKITGIIFRYLHVIIQSYCIISLITLVEKKNVQLLFLTRNIRNSQHYIAGPLWTWLRNISRHRSKQSNKFLGKLLDIVWSLRYYQNYPHPLNAFTNYWKTLRHILIMTKTLLMIQLHALMCLLVIQTYLI